MTVSLPYQDEALGLGQAVLCARDQISNGSFFVLPGDCFVPNRQTCVCMARASEAHGGCPVIAVALVPHDQVSRYGIVAGDAIPSPDGVTRGEERPSAVLKRLAASSRSPRL